MRVLVTGASSGIGKIFAEKFASQGYDLFITSRSEDVLKTISDDLSEKYKVSVLYAAYDLSDVDNAKHLYNHIHNLGVTIDVLINNAGFGDLALFADADLTKLQQMIHVNIEALVTLSHLFIADFKKQKRGYIINLGSVASFMPGPYMAVYYASKAFVLSFSMALREELKKENIGVSCLCPGPTATNFAKNANASFKKFYQRNALQTVDTGYKMYINNRAYMIDGVLNTLMVAMANICPLELLTKIVGVVQKRMKF